MHAIQLVSYQIQAGWEPFKPDLPTTTAQGKYLSELVKRAMTLHDVLCGLTPCAALLEAYVSLTEVICGLHTFM